MPVEGALDTTEILAAAFAIVAIISGRSLEDLRTRFRPPGVTLAGSYGRERSDRPGRRMTEGWEAVNIGAAVVAEQIEGVVIERKGTGVAFHYRAVPERAADVQAAAADLAAAFELEVRPGRQVVELTVPGPGKGDALARFVSEAELRRFLYAGDDLADLDAFDAARASGAESLLVAVASEESPGELIDGADLVLSGPDELVALLRELTPLR